MDKISKLNMFYNLADAQGIQTMVNIGTYFYAPTPNLDPYPTLVVKALDHVLEVDCLADSAITLMVGEPTWPLVLTKRIWEEEQKYIWTDYSPKQSHL